MFLTYICHNGDPENSTEQKIIANHNICCFLCVAVARGQRQTEEVSTIYRQVDERGGNMVISGRRIRGRPSRAIHMAFLKPCTCRWVEKWGPWWDCWIMPLIIVPMISWTPFVFCLEATRFLKTIPSNSFHSPSSNYSSVVLVTRSNFSVFILFLSSNHTSKWHV